MVRHLTYAITCLQNNTCQIFNEDEVTTCFRYKTLLTIFKALVENRQRTCNIARTNDVGQTESYKIDSRQFQVEFVRGFRDCIATTTRQTRVIQTDRLLAWFQAVASAVWKYTKRLTPVRLAASTRLEPPTQLVRVSLYQSSGSL